MSVADFQRPVCQLVAKPQSCAVLALCGKFWGHKGSAFMNWNLWALEGGDLKAGSGLKAAQHQNRAVTRQIVAA